MINIEYVNDSISLETIGILKPFESFMESCKHDINNLFSDFSILEEKVTLESSIMGSVPESMMMVYEAEKKNIFTKIGEIVISIYNKFVEFIDNLIDKIKTHSFKKKTDLQKLDILLKNHPELKNEVITAFNTGALDLSDVKSLKELDSTFDEILKMARKKDIDPKTLRGKWEKAKENFEKDEKSWKIVKVAAATTVTVTAVLALKTFKSKCAKATNDAQKDKQEMRERKAEIYSFLDEHGYITKDSGLFTILLQMWRELNGMHSAVRGENLSVIDRLSNSITSFLDRFSGKAGERLKSNLSETKNRIDDKNARTQENKRQEVRDAERVKNEVRDDHYRNNRREELKKERDKAYNQSEGREASNRRHNP